MVWPLNSANSKRVVTWRKNVSMSKYSMLKDSFGSYVLVPIPRNYLLQIYLLVFNSKDSSKTVNYFRKALLTGEKLKIGITRATRNYCPVWFKKKKSLT